MNFTFLKTLVPAGQIGLRWRNDHKPLSLLYASLRASAPPPSQSERRMNLLTARVDDAGYTHLTNAFRDLDEFLEVQKSALREVRGQSRVEFMSIMRHATRLLTIPDGQQRAEQLSVCFKRVVLHQPIAPQTAEDRSSARIKSSGDIKGRGRKRKTPGASQSSSG